MKLLFYFTQQIAPEAGGVERVVTALYHSLKLKGYDITIVFLNQLKVNTKSCIPGQIQLPVGDGRSKKNKTFLINLIREEKYDIAMNFGAIFNKSSRAFVEACISTDLPLISIYHNTLDWPIWANPKVNYLMKYKGCKKIIYYLYSFLQKNPFQKNAHYISRHSVASIVLGKSYVDQYHKFIDAHPAKLMAIYNPLTIKDDYKEKIKKENLLLFVGRLDGQKNLKCLLRIWSRVKREDWRLEIVGSGPEEENLKEYAKSLGLTTDIFKGPTKIPEEYYRKAKIFAMTSHFEGFPMTLLECQSFGCVPIIFDSYPAASEIVQDNNGILVPSFDEQKFGEDLSALMRDKIRLKSMSESAILWSEQFDLTTITDQWDQLLNSVVKTIN